MEYPETGGWSLTAGFSGADELCLMRDDGGCDIVHDANPLTVAQLRALADALSKSADELEFNAMEEN